MFNFTIRSLFSIQFVLPILYCLVSGVIWREIRGWDANIRPVFRKGILPSEAVRHERDISNAGR
jgi:hypothetical protein